MSAPIILIKRVPAKNHKAEDTYAHPKPARQTEIDERKKHVAHVEELKHSHESEHSALEHELEAKRVAQQEALRARLARRKEGAGDKHSEDDEDKDHT
jgi:hypothetical protein